MARYIKPLPSVILCLLHSQIKYQLLLLHGVRRMDLPAPTPLAIHGTDAAERWRAFKLAWENYSLAGGIAAKDEDVQVATLLTVIGEEARAVFQTFQFDDDDNKKKIDPVIQKFEDYCEPRKNVPFSRFLFYQREQKAGESYEQFKMELRKLAGTCDFSNITPEEILRDRLIFGIRDSRVRERLLREKDLTLKKTDEMCQAAESTRCHLSVINRDSGDREDAGATVHAMTRPGQGYGVRPSPAAGAQRSSEQWPRVGELDECGNCGRTHGKFRSECPALGRFCSRCGKRNHFAKKCRTKVGGDRANVRNIDVEGSDRGQQPDEEVFGVSRRPKTLSLDQQVTVQLEGGNFIRFQPDTGAECNVLPVDTYVGATGDEELKEMERSRGVSTLVAYGGSRLTICGEAIIRVWRGGKSYKLACKLVDNDTLRPILGRRACIGMGILKYMDNDSIQQPDVRGARVFATEQQSVDRNPLSKEDRNPLSKEELVKRFPTVFTEKTGVLAGTHRIRIDQNAQPIQHAPRRVPVATRKKVQLKLDELEKDDIIQKVTVPTPWINSMVTVVKPNGKLRICLDTKDLNRAVLREKYQMPTIEDVATRLHRAKVFTKLDARNGLSS